MLESPRLFGGVKDMECSVPITTGAENREGPTRRREQQESMVVCSDHDIAGWSDSVFTDIPRRGKSPPECPPVSQYLRVPKEV